VICCIFRFAGVSQATTIDVSDLAGEYICRFEFLRNIFGHVQNHTHCHCMLFSIFFFFFFLAVTYSEVDMFGSQSQEDTDGSGELSETATNYGDFVKGSDDGRYDSKE
jgi:hypothetical protein